VAGVKPAECTLLESSGRLRIKSESGLAQRRKSAALLTRLAWNSTLRRLLRPN